MIDRIQFVIPNLDRRPDRWQWMRDFLVLSDVPPENIQRVSAYDGLKYVVDGDHRNLSLLKAKAKKYFGDPLPVFLKSEIGLDLTTYGWNCTWLKCLGIISKLPENELGCIIIDDFTLTTSYNEILDYANTLSQIAKRQWRSLFAIQMSRWTNDVDPSYNGIPVPDCPFFQYGFAARDDIGIIWSAKGAHWVSNYVNQLAKLECNLDPCITVAFIQQAPAKGGFYGLAPEFDGFAFLRPCDNLRLNFSFEAQAHTDRELSTLAIENRLPEMKIDRNTINIYATFPEVHDFPIYENANPTLAVLIRLFGTGKHQEDLVRLALWSMRSHMLNSDMRDYQPSIVFHVEDALYQSASSIFDTAGVPPEYIVTFPSNIVPTRLVNNELHKAAAPFLDEQLERFERIIVLDADSFSLANERAGAVNLMDASLNQLPPDEISLLRGWVKWRPETDEYHFWYDHCGGKEEWLRMAAEYCHTSVQHIRSVMYPDDPDTTYRPFHNGAYINLPMGFLRNNPEFRTFLREISGVMGNEEIALAVWAMKHYVATGERIPEVNLQDHVFATNEFSLFWDLDDAWDSYKHNNRCFVHLYDFNGIGKYGYDWAGAIGASEEEAMQFTNNINHRIAHMVAHTPSEEVSDSRTPTQAIPNTEPQAFPLANAPRTRQIGTDIINIANAVAAEHRQNSNLNTDGYVVQHSLNELVALYEIVCGAHDAELRTEGHVLQCGLFCGGSALMMAHAARDNAQPLPVIAIDSYTKDYKPLRDLFNAAYHESRENTWELRLHEHLTAVVSDTVSFLSNFWDFPIRVAFIDSSHHYEPTKNELRLILPHLVPGGWLVLHDYFSETTPGVRQALDEFLAESPDEYNRYRVDELLILKVH